MNSPLTSSITASEYFMQWNTPQDGNAPGASEANENPLNCWENFPADMQLFIATFVPPAQVARNFSAVSRSNYHLFGGNGGNEFWNQLLTPSARIEPRSHRSAKLVYRFMPEFRLAEATQRAQVRAKIREAMEAEIFANSALRPQGNPEALADGRRLPITQPIRALDDEIDEDLVDSDSELGSDEDAEMFTGDAVFRDEVKIGLRSFLLSDDVIEIVRLREPYFTAREAIDIVCDLVADIEDPDFEDGRDKNFLLTRLAGHRFDDEYYSRESALAVATGRYDARQAHLLDSWGAAVLLKRPEISIFDVDRNEWFEELHAQALQFEDIAITDIAWLSSDRTKAILEVLNRKYLLPGGSDRGSFLVDLGKAFAAVGRHRAAVERFDVYLRMHLLTRPEDLQESFHAEVLTLRGRSLLSLNDNETALNSFNAALLFRPDWAALHDGRAQALTRLGHSDGAVESFIAAARLAPRDAAIIANWAAFLGNEGKLKEARASYELALDIKPDSSRIIMELGRTLALLGLKIEALEKFDAALEIEPYLLGAFRLRTIVLTQLGRETEAKERHCKLVWYIETKKIQAALVKAIADKDLDQSVAEILLNERAIQLIRFGKIEIDVAIERVSGPSAEGLTQDQLYGLLAGLSRRDVLADDFEEIDLISTAAASHPNAIEFLETSRHSSMHLIFISGCRNQQRREYLKALQCFNFYLEATERGKDTPQGYYRRGVILSELGLQDEAEKDYQKAFESLNLLSEDTSRGWNKWGKVRILVKQGKLEAALLECSERTPTLARDTDDDGVREYFRAGILHKMGRNAEALACVCSYSIFFIPEAEYLAGEIWHDLGNTEKSELACNNALRSDPMARHEMREDGFGRSTYPKKTPQTEKSKRNNGTSIETDSAKKPCLRLEPPSGI